MGPPSKKKSEEIKSKNIKKKSRGSSRNRNCCARLPHRAVVRVDFSQRLGVAIQSGHFAAHTTSWVWFGESRIKTIRRSNVTGHPDDTDRSSCIGLVRGASSSGPTGQYSLLGKASQISGKSFVPTPSRRDSCVRVPPHSIGVTDESGRRFTSWQHVVGSRFHAPACPSFGGRDALGAWLGHKGRVLELTPRRSGTPFQRSDSAGEKVQLRNSRTIGIFC